MSMAHECDLCGALYPQIAGTVGIEMICVATKDDPKVEDSWSSLDFCPGCSARILDVIGPALDGLDPPPPKKVAL